MTVLLGMDQQIIDDTVMSGLEAQQALFASNGDPIVLGRIGSLEVRLANSREAVEAAQELRFRVFFDEMGARRKASKPWSFETLTVSTLFAIICSFMTPPCPCRSISRLSAPIV